MRVKKFRERNLRWIAAISAAVLVLGGIAALNFSRIPLITNNHTYKADFASAVGLQKGDVVAVAGVRVGSITGMVLRGNVVRVTFTISGGIHLGATTTIEAKVLNPVGVEYLEVHPSGAGRLSGPVPVGRTVTAATFIGDINQLTKQTRETNLSQLVASMQTSSQVLQGTSPAQTKAALEGVAGLSRVLAARQTELSNLVTQADSLTTVLNQHSAQLINLLGQADLVLQVLNQRKAAITALLTTTSQLSQQISHVVVGDRSQLQPLLSNLEVVSAFLAKDSGDLNAAAPLLAAFSRYAANVAGSGPYADFVAPTLFLPDNLIAQCAKIANIDPARGCRP